MIVEGILAVIKFIVLGIIKLLPTIPTINIKYLDGVFKVLSMADLLINVKVLGACIGVLLLVMNAQLIFGVIMWVVRKLPFVK